MFARFRVLPRAQQVLLLVALVIVLAHLAFLIQRRVQTAGDFDIHREFGRRFLAGEALYEDGTCYNYLPVSGLYWAPLALVPPTVGFVVRYVAALACLWLTMRWLRALAPASGRNSFAVAVLVLLLSSQYLLRDLDDAGAHLLLLAMLVGGTYCAWQGRQKLGALWFGLAIALKLTPGILLPFLLWKRRWRLAVYTGLATVFWIVLPMAWLGTVSWWRDQQQWNHVVVDLVRGTPRPESDENELRVQNQSLKLALMHCLTAYPPDHPLRSQEANWSLLDLGPASARRWATVGMLVLLAVFCLAARPETGDMLHYSNEAYRLFSIDCAGLLILMLLLSPVTWLQHLVWTVPGLYYVVAADWSRRRLGMIANVLLGIFAVGAVVLNRELLGKNLSLLLLANHLHTVVMLILLGSDRLAPAHTEEARCGWIAPDAFPQGSLASDLPHLN